MIIKFFKDLMYKLHQEYLKIKNKRKINKIIKLVKTPIIINDTPERSSNKRYKTDTDYPLQVAKRIKIITEKYVLNYAVVDVILNMLERYEKFSIKDSMTEEIRKPVISKILLSFENMTDYERLMDVEFIKKSQDIIDSYNDKSNRYRFTKEEVEKFRDVLIDSCSKWEDEKINFEKLKETDTSLQYIDVGEYYNKKFNL